MGLIKKIFIFKLNRLKYFILNQEYEVVENDKFFALTTLIFETDIKIELSEMNIELELRNETIVAPIIKIENGNVLSKAT
jgi:hypothetical protein